MTGFITTGLGVSTASDKVWVGKTATLLQRLGQSSS